MSSPLTTMGIPTCSGMRRTMSAVLNGPGVGGDGPLIMFMTIAVNEYGPGGTFSNVNVPFGKASAWTCIAATVPPIDGPALTASDVRFTIAWTGLPAESTTMPETRALRTGAIGNSADASTPGASVIGCASAKLAVPG